MRNVLGSFFVFLAIAASGCGPASWNRAERAFRAGDMVSAVRFAAQTLAENPGHAEACDFLSQELPRAYENYETQALRAERSNDWDEAYRLYSDILAMSDAVRGLPRQIHEDTKLEVNIPTKDVERQFQAAKRKAAEQHYQAGLSFEKQGMAKDAAKEFSRVLDYMNPYQDAAQRYEANRRQAVKRVAVMPFDNLSGKEYYGAVGTIVADRIIADAMRDPRNLEFLEFVTREKITELIRELKFEQSTFVDPSTAAQLGKLLGIHSFVFGKITLVSTDYPPETFSRYEDKDEISQGSNKPKKKVSAEVTVVSRRASAKFHCSYQIVDVTRGTIVRSGNVPRTEVVEVVFGRYKGDKEALSRASRELCSRQEAYPPPDDELVNLAAEGAARALAAEIAGFFR